LLLAIPPASIFRRATMSQTREYTVHGMTCRHCVLSVTEEVTEVAGVENVAVDLASGRLLVRGDADDDAVAAAVAEAGYAVAA
jgi:copper chaperone